MSRNLWIRCYFCLAIIIALGASHDVAAQPGQPQPGQPNTYKALKADTVAPVPTGESKQVVAVTLWVLTIKESTGPEAGELEGALQDKANNLPSVVGTKKEVRDMVAKLKVAGLLKKSSEIRLVALDGQPATAQTGADQPVIQAMQIMQQGSTNNIMYRSIGTIVRATPLIDSDGLIQVGLIYESSFLDMAEGTVIAELEDKNPIVAPSVKRKSTTTMARLKSGRAVLVSSDATQDASDDKNLGQLDLLILAAEIVADQ